MARSLPVENLQPQNVGSIINYTCSNFTEVAQRGRRYIQLTGRTPHPTQGSTH